MTASELLRLAAEALDSGEDPFSGAFLGEHDVTSDQCMAMARQIAIGARIVARGLEKPKSEEGMAMFMTIAREPA